MRRLVGGYTLIEVMLFLAISLVIFAVSVVVVRGQAGESEFRTSVDAVNQQLQQWIDQVQNGLSSSTSGSSAAETAFKCTTNTSSGVRYPELNSGGGGNQRGANPDCVFLGDAILVNNQTADSNHIFEIPIVGLRVNDQGDLSSSIADSHPIAAIPDANSNVNLSQTYTIPNGTRVLWAGTSSSCATVTSNSCSYLTGFFTSLSSGAGSQAGGAQSLLAVQYPFYQSGANLSTPLVSQCLMLQNNGG